MIEKDLAGRTALVTGGGRGIGRAICVLLARAGARVAVNYVSGEETAHDTQRLIEAEGAECALVKADVSDADAVAAMVAAAEGALGPIDLLVTNAGILIRAASHTDMTFEAWRRTMAVNLDGTYLPVMAVKDGMIERGFGRIVCMTSIGGLRPRPKVIAYSASKAAVIGFARSCSEAFAPQVRVNCVAPGIIETDMTSTLDDEAKQALIRATPLGRPGRPEEIAEMVLLLLSERSSYTTGQTFVTDGGRVTLP